MNYDSLKYTISKLFNTHSRMIIHIRKCPNAACFNLEFNRKDYTIEKSRKNQRERENHVTRLRRIL